MCKNNFLAKKKERNVDQHRLVLRHYLYIAQEKYFSSVLVRPKFQMIGTLGHDSAL